jgi:hypothetical protein
VSTEDEKRNAKNAEVIVYAHMERDSSFVAIVEEPGKTLCVNISLCMEHNVLITQCKPCGGSSFCGHGPYGGMRKTDCEECFRYFSSLILSGDHLPFVPRLPPSNPPLNNQQLLQATERGLELYAMLDKRETIVFQSLLGEDLVMSKGEYRILGEGGFGRVYLMIRNGIQLAIKISTRWDPAITKPHTSREAEFHGFLRDNPATRDFVPEIIADLGACSVNNTSVHVLIMSRQQFDVAEYRFQRGYQHGEVMMIIQQLIDFTIACHENDWCFLDSHKTNTTANMNQVTNNLDKVYVFTFFINQQFIDFSSLISIPGFVPFHGPQPARIVGVKYRHPSLGDGNPKQFSGNEQDYWAVIRFALSLIYKLERGVDVGIDDAEECQNAFDEVVPEWLDGWTQDDWEFLERFAMNSFAGVGERDLFTKDIFGGRFRNLFL